MPFDEPPQDPFPSPAPVQQQWLHSTQHALCDHLVRSLFSIMRDNYEIEWLASLPGAEIVQAGGA